MDLEKIKNYDEIITKYFYKVLGYLPNILLAIVIFIVGWWIIKITTGWLRKFFLKKDYDPTLENFLLSLTNWALKVLLFVTVVSQLGVQTSSFVAIIGAAGLAIGLALQGSLANFAGGVLILLLKPFKVGDFIKGQGIEGTVKEISIFNTKLLTFGNQLAIIPNGKLSNDNIINYTEEGKRRENLVFGISYDDDVKLAKDILLKLTLEQETVMAEPAPMIVLAELADSSVNLSLRYWALNDDFWALRWHILEEGKARLEAAGISIPYPQRDVHMYAEDVKS
jgi:small conductance mechanosensitive channel